MSDAYLYAAARTPVGLIDALIRQGAGDLTVVSSNAGNGDVGLAALLEAGRVRKMTCSFPGRATPTCSTSCAAPDA